MLAAFAFAACEQAPIEELSVVRADAPETLTVSLEGDDTRIQLNKAQKTVWTKGDQVSVFYRSNANQLWKYTGATGSRTANLKRVDAGSATRSMDRVVVVYPYNEDYYINPSTFNVQASLPAVQHYLKDSYGLDGNIMISSAEYNDVTLKNVCGWLKLQLTGNGEVVKSIKFRGNNGEQVAGELYINSADATAILASDMGNIAEDEGENATGGAGANLSFDDVVLKEVTLDCGEGVELGAEVTTFYIALPPQTFERGFRVDILCDDDTKMVKSSSNTLTIERNHIQPMTAMEFTPPAPNNEIWYTSSDGNVVTPYNTNAFGASIVSNTYGNGKGVITFDGDVTDIGYYAYTSCDSITSITIPDSVTTIGYNAFAWCYSLTSITIPDSVTTIGYNAFACCYGLTSVTIPDNVMTIENGAFVCCFGLEEFMGKFAEDNGRILVVDGVLKAFAPAGIFEYTIPDSVTTIGADTFSSCSNLTSITIPDSVTTIEEYAFSGCYSLTSITIPDSVTTIGERAFRDCDSLTSVTIPDSVTAIGDGAFAYCFSLAEFKGKFAYDNGRILVVDGVLKAFAPAGISEYTIPDSVTTIGEATFSNCYSLISVTIPNSVTIIGGYAFASCISLTNVTIPDSVTTIGRFAFSYCESLTSVYCKAANPPTLDGYSNFYYNSSHRKIYVPAESVYVYQIADGWSEYASDIVAYDFENGEVVRMPNNEIWYTSSDGKVVTPHKTNAFGATIVSNTYSNGKGVITFDGDVTEIGVWAFEYCSSLTLVTIPDSVTTIGYGAFEFCDSLTSVNIHDSVTTIGYYAFYSCDSLTSVNIPDSVTKIGDYTFAYCDSLTSVTIPDSVTAIGNYAFYNCKSLTSVTIGDGVTTIGEYAFYYCHSLTEFKGKFADDNGRILVIDGVLIAFAPAGITEYNIPDSVTTIGDYAFGWCTSLTSVTIPDSVTTIGEGAFFYCTSLTSVNIPDSVTTIRGGAFASCDSLTEFKGTFASEDGRSLIMDNTIIAYANASGTTYTIPDSITTIGYAAFYECTSLTSVNIPDSVTEIGASAFRYCDSLTSVTIGDSVTTIGNYAFEYCDSLTSVNIPDSVTQIGGDAFYACTSLTSVTIGDGVTEIGYYAFYSCDSLTSVYCKATTPPVLYGDYVFNDNGSGRKIYVPTESVDAYKSATNWREYASDIVGYNF